jgi:hypothetical protein
MSDILTAMKGRTSYGRKTGFDDDDNTNEPLHMDFSSDEEDGVSHNGHAKKKVPQWLKYAYAAGASGGSPSAPETSEATGMVDEPELGEFSNVRQKNKRNRVKLDAAKGEFHLRKKTVAGGDVKDQESEDPCPEPKDDAERNSIEVRAHGNNCEVKTQSSAQLDAAVKSARESKSNEELSIHNDSAVAAETPADDTAKDRADVSNGTNDTVDELTKNRVVANEIVPPETGEENDSVPDIKMDDMEMKGTAAESMAVEDSVTEAEEKLEDPKMELSSNKGVGSDSEDDDAEEGNEGGAGSDSEGDDNVEEDLGDIQKELEALKQAGHNEEIHYAKQVLEEKILEKETKDKPLDGESDFELYLKEKEQDEQRQAHILKEKTTLVDDIKAREQVHLSKSLSLKTLKSYMSGCTEQMKKQAPTLGNFTLDLEQDDEDDDLCFEDTSTNNQQPCQTSTASRTPTNAGKRGKEEPVNNVLAKLGFGGHVQVHMPLVDICLIARTYP